MDVLRGVEHRYNRAQTVEVLLSRPSQRPGAGRRPSRGELFLRKPGRMRWQVIAGKLFVERRQVTSTSIRPAPQRVERSKVKETDDMRAPLAFLLANSISSGISSALSAGRASGFPDRRRTAVGPRGLQPGGCSRVGPAFEIRELEITGQDNSVIASSASKTRS